MELIFLQIQTILEKIMKILYQLLLSFFLLTSLAEAKLHVFALVKKEAVGDYNQVLGIQTALKQLSHEDIDFKEFNFEDLQQVSKEIRTIKLDDAAAKVVLLSVGDYGLNAFKKLKEDFNNPRIYYVLSSHQLTDALSKEKDTVDLMALPSHAVDAAFVKAKAGKLVQTIGVAHNLNRKEIETAYKKDRDNIIPLQHHKQYIAVMLGGDAPDLNGKMLYYTAAEAEKLANYLAALAKQLDAVILVMDGPRTGKYDQKTGIVDEQAHKNGKLTFVSQAFKDALSKHLPEDQFSFYDFQFGQSSMSKAIYGAVIETQGLIFIPGESTTMVSEAIDNFDKGKVIVYQNSAMNMTHLKHVKTEQGHRRVKLLDINFNEVKSSSKKKANSLQNESASTTIAKAIKKLLKG